MSYGRKNVFFILMRNPTANRIKSPPTCQISGSILLRKISTLRFALFDLSARLDKGRLRALRWGLAAL